MFKSSRPKQMTCLQFFGNGGILIFWIVLTVNGLKPFVQDPCTDVADCITCENPTISCIGCQEKQGLLANGRGCLDCPELCEECVGNNHGSVTCTKCHHGYTLNKENKCIRCVPNCRSCTVTSAYEDTSCDECYKPDEVDRYFIEAQDGHCLECPLFCMKCFLLGSNPDQTVCSKCKPGHRLESGLCKACPVYCKICWSDGTDEYCYSCIDNDESGTYFLRNDKCRRCGSRCETCDTNMIGNNYYKCATCREGYYYDETNGNCNRCPSSCATCDSGIECTSCRNGYFLDLGTKQCTDCGICSNCRTVGYSTFCDCPAGYGFDSYFKVCRGCPINCDFCWAWIGTVYCNRCDIGYGLHPHKTNCIGCVEMIPGCTNCTDIDENGQRDGLYECYNCKEGYVPNENKTQCRECSDDCLMNCAVWEDKPYQCTQCESGMSITRDGQCSNHCYSCRGEDCDNVTSLGHTTDYYNLFKACPQSMSCWTYRYAEESTMSSITYIRDCLDLECTYNHAKEICRVKNQKRTCSSCCTEDKCNTVILRGQTDGSTVFFSDIYFVCVCILVMLF